MLKKKNVQTNLNVSHFSMKESREVDLWGKSTNSFLPLVSVTVVESFYRMFFTFNSMSLSNLKT